MQAETHPDYYTLEPEKGKSTLGIDAVRAVSEKLYERARLGGAKVVWLKDAAQLTEAAANALLKTLEEPPGNTWFLLSCREPGRLLATLRSRCRLHHLDAPQESWAVSWLQREVTTSQETALTALRLCGGAPAAALALLQPALWAQREQLCQAIGQAGENRDWLSLLANLNHDQVTNRLQWLASLLLDALKVQQGATLVSNVDVWPLVTQLAQRHSGAWLRAVLHDVCQCREQMISVTGLNRELVLTDLLLQIEQYLQPGAMLPDTHL
jgi:DNA polymerase-3 subunit delta'